MNCKQANKIDIKKVLASFSLFPSKKTKRGGFFYAVDRNERTPSLHVNFKKNTAHDFGTGKNYDVISIVQAIKGCSVPEALDYLSQFSFSFPKQEHFAAERKKEDPKIRKIKTVEHPALINYLKKRRVYRQRSHLKEIHYTVGNKFYFGIGFQNDSDGWEIRNKYSKVCLGRKGLTTIKNGGETLRVFEGFFDYLSFLELRKYLEMPQSNYIILNSVALVDKIQNCLGHYRKIELYMDNDEAGNKATEKIKMAHPKVEDNRILYRNDKDLNEFLKRKNNPKKRNIGLKR